MVVLHNIQDEFSIKQISKNLCCPKSNESGVYTISERCKVTIHFKVGERKDVHAHTTGHSQRVWCRC
ncbi:hypothetical protein EB796_016464 [Bugula neritina]|uniref:Uncharacterized protein n=1 Tax=Bugula neritina TaxID=10212 RepID=A0A7J7JIN5_BUGNE|nr:hypothetical protein EB796_016464 [Bugula neritina]